MIHAFGSRIFQEVCKLEREINISFARAEAMSAKIKNSMILFYKLHDDIIINMCSFLSLKDLFFFSKVSERFKNLVEIYLALKKTLIIENGLTRSMLKWLIKLCVNVERIHFSKLNTTCVDNLDLFEQKLLKVDSLIISNSKIECLNALALCFPKVKILDVIKCNTISGTKLKDIFAHFNELNSITLYNSSFQPNCLDGIQSQLKCFKCAVPGLFYFPLIQLLTSLEYAFDLEHLEIRTCSTEFWGPDIEEVVPTVFMKYLGFLKTFKLQLNGTIVGLDQWTAYDLEELSLNIAAIDGSLCLMKQLYSLKKLHLDIMRVNDFELSALLMNFPVTEELSIISTRNKTFELSSRLIICFSSLQNLSKFTLEDKSLDCYHKFSAGQNNMLFNLVEALKLPRIIKIDLSCIYGPHINSIEEEASRRPQQQITVNFQTTTNKLVYPNQKFQQTQQPIIATFE